MVFDSQSCGGEFDGLFLDMRDQERRTEGFIGAHSGRYPRKMKILCTKHYLQCGQAVLDDRSELPWTSHYITCAQR